jgi:hypothetical protein
MKELIPTHNIHEMIYLVRGQKVMLDRQLSALYDVAAGALNRAVKRNLDRFPDDFMFQLTVEEWENLKCQIGTSRWGGDRRALPYVFTEQGVAMLSSVLKSQKAVQVNIMIMRAFVRLRQMVSLNRALAKRLAALERRLTGHDTDILHIYQVIQDLSGPARIGFKPAP